MSSRSESRYRQGFSWAGDDRRELDEIIEAAFDYRGDITLGLASGETLDGYLSNRVRDVDEPFVDIFPKGGHPRRRIPYSDIRALSFSGKDTASGKSWETWIQKWNAKKVAEARGEEVGDISLYPDPL